MVSELFKNLNRKMNEYLRIDTIYGRLEAVRGVVSSQDVRQEKKQENWK